MAQLCVFVFIILGDSRVSDRCDIFYGLSVPRSNRSITILCLAYIDVVGSYDSYFDISNFLGRSGCYSEKKRLHVSAVGVHYYSCVIPGSSKCC